MLCINAAQHVEAGPFSQKKTFSEEVHVFRFPYEANSTLYH